MISHHDHDDGYGAVHQGQGAVLQLTSLDTLTVHVGQLLHLVNNTISQCTVVYM
jgi:hypothetical protein